MEYNLYYNISALLILIMLSILMGIKNDIKNHLYRFLLVMLTLLVLSIAADSVCLYFPYVYQGMSDAVITIYMSLSHFARAGIVFLSCIYVVRLVNHKRYSTPFSIVAVVPFLCVVAILIHNGINKTVFYFDSERIYRQGADSQILYLALASMWMLTFLYTVFNRKLLSKREETTIYIMIAIQATCGAIQLIFPLILIENFGYALSFIAVCTGIRNLEETIDYTTQVYARHAFYDNVQRRVEKKDVKKDGSRDFQLVTIYFKNIQLYLEMIGLKYEDLLLKKCARFLKHTFPNARVYYLGDDIFSMIIDKKDYVFTEEDIMEIQEHFEHSIVVGNYRLLLEQSMLVLDLSPDELSFEDINECINYGHTKSKSNFKGVLHKADVDINEIRRAYGTMHLLKKAVETEGFEIAYQPIYSAQHDCIVSAEALIRLQDEVTLGYISPEEFIPIAEKGGLILQIGEIVLRKVCRFISENKEKLEKSGVRYIEVNLSTIQCMEYGIDKKAIEIMKEFNVEPSWINFEITETAEVNSLDYLRKNINELQKSDISFSLDDYGSGNANINYLLELPFEIVKIDKFILWNAFQNPTQMEALESTVHMLHELGIKIVVEGIENEEYLEKMKSLGCEYFQGYYFAKPMSEQAYLEYCVKQKELVEAFAKKT